jgi:aryl-alcohol dehydrogenase-like predicted oxidoreductase
VDEMMRTLDDVVRSGKVMYVGISDAPAWIVTRAQTIAQLKNMTRLPRFNLNIIWWNAQ